MKTIKLLAASLLLCCANLTAQVDEKGIIADGAKLEQLADGFKFTEGPAVDKNGDVYFTDQPNDRIWKWSTSGKLTLFMENTGRSNGLYFDKKGQLLSCADLENELWSIDTKTKKHKVLLTDYKGGKLNGPNDLWITPANEIYFTDPLYKRPYWKRNPETQQTAERVYLLTKKGEVRVAAEDYVRPNGIIGTADGKVLYVTDLGDKKTYRYDIAKDGSLKNKKLFVAMGSDGMTLDEEGNLYITGKGVTVFDKTGEKIAHIPVDRDWTANVCFGGKDMKTLFITAKEGLYALRMNVKGIR